MEWSNMQKLLANRYELIELIGKGGMAEVYTARDLKLKRIVAVKILRDDLAKDSQFLMRFTKEAHSSASLNNSNIVAVYDTGEQLRRDSKGFEINVPYIVMEYVKGKTLKSILRERGFLPYTEACRIMISVLSALEYSNKAGIVHRDIKPGNIMISESGLIKVMDFGIARAISDSAETLTQSKSVIGTAQYLSPEQARGEVVDARSDIYSAGCVFYEMLVGKPPFTGDSAVSVAYQHVQTAPIQPSIANPNVPPVFDKVIGKALEKVRNYRYQTAHGFKQDITIALSKVGTSQGYGLGDARDKATTVLPVSIPPAGSLMANAEGSNMGNYAGQTGFDNSNATDEKSKKNRQKKIIIGVVVAVLVAAAVIAGIALNGGFGGDKDKNSPSTITTTTQSSSSTTKTPESVNVPNVKGYSQDEARKSIESAGLKVSEVNSENSSEIPKDMVTRTDPNSGTRLDKDSTVKLFISTGYVDLPDFVGKTQQEVNQIISDEKLKSTLTISFETIDSDKPLNTVVSQDPEAGTLQQYATVKIQLSSGQSGDVIIPSNLIGQTLADAQYALQNLGLNVEIQQQEGSTEPPGTVILCVPDVGTTVKKGSTVTLVISPLSSN
jgi:serine/threonine-protein kinase